MIYTKTKVHTDPYLLTNSKIKTAYDFVLNYADTCLIETQNFHQKEVQIYRNFDDFLHEKSKRKNKLDGFTIRAYTKDEEIISLAFNNPKKKIFPFIDPHTLESNISIQDKDKYAKFMNDYEEKIESLVSYKRVSYKILYSFLPSFFAALFTAMYMISLAKYERSTIENLLTLILAFLLFSILANIIIYPFLYMHNPLVQFEKELKKKRNIYSCIHSFVSYFKDNAKAFFIGTLTALSLFFYHQSCTLL